MTTTQQLVFTVAGAQDTEATANGQAVMGIERPGRSLSWRTESSLRSRGGQYRYQFRRVLTSDGTVVRERNWEYVIPRRLQ